MPDATASSNKEHIDLSGQSLGEFVLLRRIGQGGMGQVYLAEQASLKRRVALKLLRKELAGNEISRKRFKAEAEAVAQLGHANIVQVYAVGEQEGLQYMALEYVDGRNLKDFIARKGPPELPLALSIIRQSCAALQRAHDIGIIHRDIKPENILLTRKGAVKVADFGLSRMIVDGEPALNLTQTGTTMGTPLYMSPEQVEGKPLDARTDIYSLGVTCYHMLAGQPPFTGENAYAVAIQHVKSEPPELAQFRPDLPPELSAILAKMLAKKPDDRYSSPREILKDLKQLGDILSGTTTQPMLVNSAARSSSKGETSSFTTATLTIQTQQFLRKRAWLLAKLTASILLTFAGGSLAAWVWNASVGPPAPEIETPIDDWTSLRDQETALRTMLQRHEAPKKENERQRGLQDRLDLALLLLKQNELDGDALNRSEKLFQEWSQSPVESYALLGQIGEAIVLAFQDKPAESNPRFVKLQPKLFRQGLNALRSPELLRVISDAVDHNQRNDPAGFPRELELMRKPLDMRRPGGENRR